MLKCYYQNIVIVVCVLLIKVFFFVVLIFFSLSDLFGELIYEPGGGATAGHDLEPMCN